MRFLASFLPAVLSFGCTAPEPEHVSPAEFKKRYEWVGQPQTISDIAYLGQHDGRAFIRISQMSLINQKTWSDHIIYVELKELDPAFRDVLPKTEFKK